MHKDYYKILELPMKASLADIKQAYRKMARAFHPDVTNDESKSVFFHDIQEAYEVLSHPVRRSNYDFELKKAGKYAGYDKVEVISAEDIGKQSADLLKYVSSQRDLVINHDALADFILGLLNTENLQIINRKSEPKLNQIIVRNILDASASIQVTRIYQEIVERLLILIPDSNHSLHQEAIRELNTRKKAEEKHRLVPLIAFILIAIFAFLSYLIVKK
jgi:molecular chaperone DnaJ